jgi:class 3 adenylate cyclase
MQRAEPNEILIGPRASELLKDMPGQASPAVRRSVTLKGKAAPVDVVTLRIAPA